MKAKKTSDLIRVYRRFCNENDLLFEEKVGPGPHITLKIYERSGSQITKVSTVILRNDKKELSPGSLRRIMDHLKKNLEERMAREGADHIVRLGNKLLEQLEKWCM